jgi:hypothetical protein
MLNVNWDAVGAVAEVIAALAVLVTLLLLLKQVRISNSQARQANDLARADSQRDILKQVADHSVLVIGRPELHEDIRQCYESWSRAPSRARWNFEGWAAGYFYILEQAVYMHDQGLLSDETYQAMENAALRIVETPGGAEWWKRKAPHIGAGVSNRINGRLAEKRSA